MNLEDFENMNDGWEEWPSFPENEGGFDWSLSYEQMEKHYPPANFYKESLELKSIIAPYNTKKKRAKWFQERQKDKEFNYKSSTSFPKTVEEKSKKVTGGIYVNYMGKDCPCVGFIDRAVNNGVKQYQNAFYHSGEEKYVFKVLDGVVAFHKASVEKFIKPFFPDAKDVKLSVNTNISVLPKETLDQQITRLLSQPQMNFHYEG